MLEKEGLIAMSESFEEPSKVRIKASRDDLYRFQVSYPQFDPLIKYLLRNLPGVLSDFVVLSEETVAQKTGLRVDQVVAQLKQLEAYNFLSYAPRNEKPKILMLTEFLDTRYFELSKENYADRKRDAFERVKSVIDFVRNDQECRSVQLLRYFNEDTCKSCGRCDVCLNRAEHELEAVEYDQVRHELLSVLQDHPLTGSGATPACHDHDEEEVLESIRWLDEKGVVDLDREHRLTVKNKKTKK